MMNNCFVAGFSAQTIKMAQEAQKPNFWGIGKSRKLKELAIEEEGVPIAKRLKLYKSYIHERAKEEPISHRKTLGVGATAAGIGAGLGGLSQGLEARRLLGVSTKALSRSDMAKFVGKRIAKGGLAGGLMAGIPVLGIMELIRAGQKGTQRWAKRIEEHPAGQVALEKAFLEDVADQMLQTY